MPNVKTDLFPSPSYSIIGHRGAGRLAPENTLTSFKLAKTLGLNWVELDTQVCGSGEWVVIHDDTLDRTSNGMGLVQKTCLKSLKSLDAGSWFNLHFSKEPIPLLSEALSLLADLNLHPNIEIKGDFQTVQPYLPDFLNILKTCWPNYLPLPLISSYSLEILVMLQQTNPNVPLGYVVEETKPDTLNVMLEYRFASLHCNHQYFYGFPLSLRQLPFSTLLYTVNEPQRAASYFQQGVAAIFSDFPNLFIPK